MANHLVHETSPYLLQHAHNAVDWYPWGEEALTKARTEDKPIFLSIGYSACHWCHVMAHESFEDEDAEAVRLLNDHFVSIKVDREERPDLDRIYMDAVQAMTGSGGWPMSVFITSDGYPFYGGTYFPPAPRFGMPSFSDVLHAIIDAWKNQRSEIMEGGRRVAAAIERQVVAEAPAADLQPETIEAAFRGLWQSFDQVHGGWGRAPKFPQPMALEFLLRYHYTTHNQQALQMVTQTLEAMARGGVYDQVGGGFHRYSVDNRWLVPHFEKMLYDNAQLARVYLHAWQVTGEALYRTVTEEILDYVLHEMADPAGGFYSTQDADSEGEEGKFYLWTPDEIRAVLGANAEAFMAAYGVTPEGNFEGRSILEFVGDLDTRATFADDRHRLFEAREERVRPGRDEKVLTSWNGLMLAAFAETARALARDDYRQVAERNADFILRQMQPSDGRLLHSWKEGQAKIDGFLEDYSYLVEGLIELYQATFDARWYQAARDLAETLLTHFQAPGGGFFDTGDEQEALIIRPRDLEDNATPSGNSMAATVLLKLAGLAGEPRYVDFALHSLPEVQPLLARYPLGFGQWLVALDYALALAREVAIVGQPGADDARALLAVANSGYRPHQILALGAPDGDLAQVPILQDRGQVDGQAAAYVCTNFACQAPVTEPEALEALLQQT